MSAVNMIEIAQRIKEVKYVTDMLICLSPLLETDSVYALNRKEFRTEELRKN